MARSKGLTIDQAKARAGKLHDWAEGIKEEAQLSARFGDAGPHRVIEMWETGRVIEKSRRNGKPLTKFELTALAERWCGLFGCYPPSLGNGQAQPLEHVQLKLSHGGFPTGREYGSRCMLEAEASMHGTSLFARFA